MEIPKILESESVILSHNNILSTFEFLVCVVLLVLLVQMFDKVIDEMGPIHQ